MKKDATEPTREQPKVPPPAKPTTSGQSSNQKPASLALVAYSGSEDEDD